MYLVQLFIPLTDNEGLRFAQADYQAVERTLAEQFGGVTAYARAPASGLWKDSPGSLQQDDLVIYEVLTDALHAAWWRDYRRQLEGVFRQERLLVRAQQVELL